MLLDDLQPFAISLFIGLGAGLERERSQTEGETTSGVRTFALIALLGTTAARADSQTLTAVLGLAVVALTTSGYWRVTSRTQDDGRKPDFGLTTEVAAALVFGLGYLAAKAPFLAGILGVATVSILHSRKRLHVFAHHVLRPNEITAVLILAVVAFVVVPFLPDRALDPWGLVNLRKVAQIMTLIAGIEFGGYVVERVAGPRVGLLVAGFFGGLASSTAVFLGLPKTLKERPETFAAALGSGLFATAATILFYVAIIGAASPALVVPVGVPAAAAAAVALALGWVVGHRHEPSVGTHAERRYPLDIRAVLKLGAFISILLMLTAAVKTTFGVQALDLVSFVGGLFELHSVSFANATLHAAGGITKDEATKALLLALGASFISKLAISWALAFGRFAFAMTGLLTVVAGTAGVVFMLLRP